MKSICVFLVLALTIALVAGRRMAPIFHGEEKFQEEMNDHLQKRACFKVGHICTKNWTCCPTKGGIGHCSWGFKCY